MGAEGKESPYTCHVFVCVNERPGGRKSCGGSGNAEVRSRLKEEVKRHGWEGKVRVSGSLCMGLCGDGPNVVVYPHKIWYPGVSTDDVDAIVERIAQLIG